MSQSNWVDLIYLYGEDHKKTMRAKISEIASMRGREVSYKDFEQFDIMHPGGHKGLDLLKRSRDLPSGLRVFDVGCGIGGSCRYLSIEYGWNVHGVDYLSHFVEIGTEINSLLKLEDNIELYQGDIRSYQAPEEAFDLAITIGVFIIVEGIEGFRTIFNSLKPEGIYYFEDYYLLKEKEDYTQEERKLIEEFAFPGIRSKNQMIANLQSVGFVVEEFNEYSREWSEFAWNRSEGILRDYYDESKPNPGEMLLNNYGRHAPQILRNMKHFTPEQLLANYPLTCAEIDGVELVHRTPEIIGVGRLIAKKPDNQ